jgi:hypothetical protein
VSFKFVQWTGLGYKPKDRPRLWFFSHRLANAYRVQLGPICIQWPMPWCDAVKDLPGYGLDRPSGIRSALGWKQRAK